MNAANLIRWGALAAMASGTLWIAGGLLHLAYPQDPPGALGHYLNCLGTAVFSAAYLGMLGRMVELHARQVAGYGRLGKTGFSLASAGAALAFVGQATSGIFPHNGALGWLFGNPGFGFMPGIILTSLGLVLMGAPSGSWRPYAPECVEGLFSELRPHGVLRSSCFAWAVFSLRRAASAWRGSTTACPLRPGSWASARTGPA